MQINDFKDDFNKVIEFLKTDIAGLRTGRANAIMLDTVQVESYGTMQPVKAVASITVVDAKTLNIEPWDKSVLGAIEKAIRDSGLGVSPVNDGRMIRLSMPELTIDRRAELIKVLHQKLEAARIAVRKVREEVRELIAAEEKDGNIGEDEKYRLQEDLEKIVKEYNEQVKAIGDKKEAEINTI